MWRSIGVLFYWELYARMRALFPPANPDPRIIDGHVVPDTVFLLPLPSARHQFPGERFEG
jgi:hypothetical protein